MKMLPTLKPERKQMSPRLAGFIVLVVILLLTGLVYQELFYAGYIDDSDRNYAALGTMWAARYESTAAQWQENLRDSWHQAFDIFTRLDVHRPENTGGFYQPLVALTLAIDAMIAPNELTRPFHFHLTNLILHLINTSLVFLLLRRFTKSLVWPALLALIFAWHPLQVESVAWVTQRMTLLAATFALLSTLCYVHYAQTGRSRWMIPALICYSCIMLTRPLFLGLPAVFLVLDIWPLHRQGVRTLLEKTPFFALMFVGNMLDRYVRDQAPPIRGGGVEGIEAISHNVASLFTRIFVPVKLSPFHPADTTVAGVALGTAFDVAIIAALVLGLFAAFRWSKPVFVALAGAMMLVLPALIQAPYSTVLLSDQYLYAVLVVPLVCIAAWVAATPERVHSRVGQWAAMATACVVAFCGVSSYAQTMYWHSDRDIAHRSIEIYPNKAFGYVALVEAYMRDNDPDTALRYAEMAERVEPDNPSTQYYLGRVLLLHSSGRSAKAVKHLKRALESNPNWIDCLHYLGVALASNEQFEEAVPYLERARDLKPNDPLIRQSLGTAYLEIGKFTDARRELSEALRRRNNSAVHLGLAVAWAANDMPDLAQRHLAAAIAKDPASSLRAARWPQLQKYRDLPGFESLNTSDKALRGQSPTDPPA